MSITTSIGNVSYTISNQNPLTKTASPANWIYYKISSPINQQIYFNLTNNYNNLYDNDKINALLGTTGKKYVLDNVNITNKNINGQIDTYTDSNSYYFLYVTGGGIGGQSGLNYGGGGGGSSGVSYYGKNYLDPSLKSHKITINLSTNNEFNPNSLIKCNGYIAFPNYTLNCSTSAKTNNGITNNIKNNSLTNTLNGNGGNGTGNIIDSNWTCIGAAPGGGGSGNNNLFSSKIGNDGNNDHTLYNSTSNILPGYINIKLADGLTCTTAWGGNGGLKNLSGNSGNNSYCLIYFKVKAIN